MHSWEDKWFYTFHKGFTSKGNLRARPKFELTYFGAAAQHYAITPGRHIESIIYYSIETLYQKI